MKIETLAIQSTKDHGTVINSVSAPIHLSTTYLRNEDGSFTNDFRYSRLDNPNRRILENSLALLEKGEVAYAFSSGMAAVNSVFQSFNPGDHILIPDDVFFNVNMLALDVFKKWGIDYSTTDMSNLKMLSNALKSNTKLIWLETPSNPSLKITEINAVVKIAKSKNILVAVDNTWATPILTNPIDLGADIVMHSTTKYFGGHSDVMGGCLIFRSKNNLSNKIGQIQILSGAVPSPFDCWLISRGIKSLSLRIKAQSKSAKILAKHLLNHEKIESVIYPGLKIHPQKSIAQKQMKNGSGAMLSVLIKGNQEATLAVSNHLKLFARATSLGGVESLVEHRKSVEGPDSNTPDNLLRISVGLEHIDDLIEDWNQALKFIM